jgi:Ca2+-binding RTX toxin-like protein
MVDRAGVLMVALLTGVVVAGCSTDGADSTGGGGDPSSSATTGATETTTNAGAQGTSPGAGPANDGITAPSKDEPGFDALPICFGRHATILGSKGADRIVGTRGADVIVTRDGDDHVSGLRGDDRVCTGPGADTVVDVDDAWGVALGAGHDRIHDAAPSEVRAGSGDDRIVVAVRSIAVLIGGEGDDLLRVELDDRKHAAFNTPCVHYYESAPVRINLARRFAVGRGRDRLVNVQCVVTGPSDDHVVGTTKSDIIAVGTGANRVWALAGNDSVYNYASNATDVFHLGPGDDEGHPGGGPDRVYGGPGDDWVEGFGGPDYLEGGPGDDRLHGGGMCDFGSSSGAGTIDTAPNEIFGGPGADYLTGDLGNDRLDGGPGNDHGQGGFRDGRVDWIESLERIDRC